MGKVGIVYKWKDPFLGSSFWKEYRLSLDEKGWIVWSKVTGEVKAVARVHVVFPRIRCQPLDIGDPRVANAIVRIAPYTLVIPMKLQYGSRGVEEVEFALRTLDDLQEWMGNFASALGASEQFEQIEKTQGRTYVVPAERFVSMYPRGNAFVYTNRYSYAPDWYPVWWSSFQTCGFDYHDHGASANINDDSNWMYPGGDTFSYGGDGGDTFSYGGDPHPGSGGDHGSFSYGGDDHGGSGDGGFSYGGDQPESGGGDGGGSFSYGGDDHGGDTGSFSHGGDSGGGGGDDGGFSYGGDTGGGDTSGGGGGDDGGFSYGGDTGGGDTSGGGGTETTSE